MSKIVQFCVQRADKILFLTMVSKRRLGTGPKTALSIDRDLKSPGDVNVLISTNVMLHRAMPPWLRVVL